MVADAEAVTQICTRRNDFPKPIEMYGSVDLFGKNVVSTEGSIWRHHRKITSPPFTEKNNYQVWLESLHQGSSMLTSWIRQGTDSKTKVSDVGADTMRLSLHVISRAGFGVRLLWPHEELEQSGQAGAIPEGHTMTYKDALSTLLENILSVMLIPRWFLIRSPIKANQIAYQSFLEWGKYMREMYQEKKAEVKAGQTPREGMDLMGALISGAGITEDTLNTEDTEKGTKQMLTDDEILGNAFVFILAGHETAANTLHFSMLFLAMNWGSQARLHRDIDDIFGSRPVSEWDYDHDVPKLFGSMVGAVMNEELRLIPPVIGIPKSTPKGSPQPMTINGKRVIVPAFTHVTLDTAATHRNPKYWPTLCGPGATDADIEKDLDTFKPERWLLDSKTSALHTTLAAHEHDDDEQHQQQSETDAMGARDTSASLFRPARGAYIPFSEGYRACLGRRFAQVEVLAVLAVIFRDYSVELALDEFASEDEVAGMSGAEREKTWRRAKTRAEGLLKHGMGSIITIQMRDGKVPMKFVKRGSERFMYD